MKRKKNTKKDSKHREQINKERKIKKIKKQKIDDIRPLTKEGLSEILGEKNYATKADILELKRMIEKLEVKLGVETKI